MKVLCWNIQVGSMSPLFGNGWRSRRKAVQSILLRADADVICLQEALLEQLDFIDSSLYGFDRVGVGRDDGLARGEHCPIYFKSERLVCIESGTFWLSDGPESHLHTWDGPFKRICTYARLKGRTDDLTFWIFNTHFPLNLFAQPKAARLVVSKMQVLCKGEPRILCGDFNCGPESTAWKIFEQAQLANAEAVSGRSAYTKTQQLFGIPAFCIDALFISRDIKVSEYATVEPRADARMASDHCALTARLESAFLRSDVS